LCEDFGADALPVLSCGMACQFESDVVAHDEDLLPFIQDAVDLIEFANGPVTSEWGKVRAEMGHPESFNLKMIAIGNEQWGEEYPPHLEAFMDAIGQKYPDIKIVGSSGPGSDGKDFDYLWKEMKRLDVDLVDEHYYRDPQWFLNNVSRYDSYDRNGPKVFAGEYACHDHPEKKNSFYSALCEAAFMTGLERNSDVVHLATYAPLFAHIDAWQWKPDMIWFDNLRSVKSANYYVQQLYAENAGTEVLSATSNGEDLTGQNGLYVSSSKNENTGEISIKLAYVGKEPKTVEIDLKNILVNKMVKGKQIILKAPLTAENTLDNPGFIVPTEKEVTFNNQQLKITVGPESFNVFVFENK
jgi:alpha-L-arabinofuranosidase